MSYEIIQVRVNGTCCKFIKEERGGEGKKGGGGVEIKYFHSECRKLIPNWSTIQVPHDHYYIQKAWLDMIRPKEACLFDIQASIYEYEKEVINARLLATTTRSDVDDSGAPPALAKKAGGKIEMWTSKTIKYRMCSFKLVRDPVYAELVCRDLPYENSQLSHIIPPNITCEINLEKMDLLPSCDVPFNLLFGELPECQFDPESHSDPVRKCLPFTGNDFPSHLEDCFQNKNNDCLIALSLSL